MAINRTKVLDAAQKHRRKGNLERAIKEYRTLMEDDPTDQRMLLVLADLYVKTHKVDEALNAYKSIAYHYLKDDIYDKAVGVFKQALNLEPSDPTLRRDLGEAYHRMGRLKEAVGEYHQAQRLYEERKDVHNQRDILERMVRLEPDEPALRIKLAEHYVRLNMLEEAVGLFEYAARQFEEDGRLDDYLKVMERIIYMRPQNTEIRKKVAQHYLDAREPQKALKHLRNCFEISNTDVDTLRMMSFSFEQLGDTPKAVLVYSQLAKLYRDHGDAQRSHQVYEHILKLDPNHADARKMLAYDARQQQQQRVAQPQQPATPQVHVIPEVEFLDDDLAAELGPPPGVVPPQKPVPRPQKPVLQKPVPRPQRPAPEKPASTSQNDLLSFAASTLDDLGDIGIDHIRSEPELPMLEIQPMDLEPIELEPEQTDEELDIRQAIDESRVFVKYGLRDRAVQTIGELVQRFPHSIESREELALLYEKYGEKVLAADQCIELAKLVRATPSRTTHYLEEATRLFGNRAQVEAIASAENLPFGSAIQDIPENNFTSVDLLAEMDLDGALSSLGGEPAPLVASVHDDEIFELDDLDIELEDDFDASDLEMDTGPIDAQALALEDISELNLDTDEVMSEDFEDLELLSIDDLSLPQDTEHDHRIPVGFGADVTVAQDSPRLSSAPKLGSGLSFTADEADAMFDDLFGDSSEMPSVNMSFSGSQDLGGLAEVDFLMEQGLVSEAEDALKRAEVQNPESASIQRRRLNLQDMRSSGNFENPFSAANSLSKQFAYNSVDEMAAAQHQGALAENSVPSLIGAGDNAVNTNFELGAAYMEMGLFDEAIEEFQQSLHDPDVAESASYNIALCEFKLGKAGQARQRLEQLLGKPSLTANVRSSASSLLARVG